LSIEDCDDLSVCCKKDCSERMCSADRESMVVMIWKKKWEIEINILSIVVGRRSE
jgi:hypothetical protein